MNSSKLLSVTLAGVLQFVPLARVLVTVAPGVGVNYAVISTWIAGALALMGGFDSVSGASTTITSPKTAKGTNGVAFSYRITTGPEVANTFAAAPLPAGLTVSTTSGRITGIPTVSGVTTVHLTASDNGKADRTVVADLLLTIVDAGVVVVPPSITTQPGSQTVNTGANVSFSVAATGGAPLAYQWRRNGANVGGATSVTLSLTSVTTNNAGNYTAVVSNSGGAVTSSVAVLIVNAAAVAPAITTPPASQTVIAGNNATFSVVASGTAPFSYQWKRNGTNITGATASILSLTAVTTNQAGSYTVVVSNSAGSVTSIAAILAVTVPIVAPLITAQPVNQSVSAGDNASFSVTASGTAPLSYQWKRNGANIAGANVSTLSLTSVTTNQTGNYTVVVTNAAGSATSAAATLTVTTLPVAPTILTPPAGQSVTAGASVTLSVVASGTAPFSHQWKFNGANIPGATASTLNLTAVTTNQAGGYSVVVTNVAGAVTSSPATLIVIPVVINAQPVISPIPNHVFVAGTAYAPIPFVIGDAESSAGSLALSKSSANTTLLPLAGIVFGGSGSNRTVTLTPQSGQTGDSLVTITVSDGTVTAASAFLLTVQPANTNPPTLLTLGTHGSGTITPDLGAKPLTLGKRYTLRAIPAKGFEFAGWSGSSNLLSPTLTFTMTSNLTFTADFVESPFIPAAGAYNGLFYENDEVRLPSSGCFKLLVTARGQYSGTIQFARSRHSISGKLDLNCRATNIISRANLPSFKVEIALGMNSEVGQVNGRITDGTWSATLSGARNDFNLLTNPATLAGRYTFTIDGRGNDPLLPAGDGFGTMRISSNGVALFAGTLADGTRMTRSATLTPDGAWPLFAPLYGGQGAVMSWFVFQNSPDSDVDSQLKRIKSASPRSKYYPLGFTNETKVVGSLYTYPIGSIATPILNMPAAEVSFTGGGLLTDFADPIAISYYTKITNMGTNTLKMTFSVASGSFSGTVEDPAAMTSKRFQGVAIQKRNTASGFMLGDSQSSRVSVSAP